MAPSDVPSTIDELRAAPYNPREIDDDAADGLRSSIGAFGDISGITYNSRTGHIVSGHQRVAQLRELGGQIDGTDIVLPNGDRFAIRVVDWHEAKERSANITANNQHISGRFTGGLQSLLSEMQESMPKHEFDSLRLDRLLESIDSDDDDGDPPPDAPDKAPPICKRGDVWQLGDHLLMCGDSTNAGEVGAFMRPNLADICFTSPPYGMGDAAALRNTGIAWADSKKSLYAGNADTPAFQTRSGKSTDSWRNLMRGFVDAASAAVRVDGYLCVNVQMLAGNKRSLIDWLGWMKDRIVDVAIWNKLVAVPAMQPGLFNSAFEFVFIFGDTGADRRIRMASWHGDIMNVYSAPGNQGNEYAKDHGATMPTHLAEHFIGKVFDKATSVYEPFCGTGTTLVVCESLGRRCYAAEIEPSYCDITIERWQKQTGRRADRVREAEKTESQDRSAETWTPVKANS